MSIAIPLTSTTDNYSDPGAAVFDFGGTPYSGGYLYVQNAGAYVSLKTAQAQGSSTWGPEFATNTALIPLAGGADTRYRPNGPDRIYGVRCRSLLAGTAAIVYGGVFQEGEAGLIPSNQIGGTITPSGGIIPPSAVTTLNFQHNGVSVGNETTLDFSDAGGTTFTVTDDAPNNRVIVTALGSSAVEVPIRAYQTVSVDQTDATLPTNLGLYSAPIIVPTGITSMTLQVEAVMTDDNGGDPGYIELGYFKGASLAAFPAVTWVPSSQATCTGGGVRFVTGPASSGIGVTAGDVVVLAAAGGRGGGGSGKTVNYYAWSGRVLFS
ncbi:MAG: hypothetical protein WCI12_09320 [Actinomycetes bacterium]